MGTEVLHEPWFLYGNWKLHGTVEATQSYFHEWPQKEWPAWLRVGIAVPLPFLAIAAQEAARWKVAVGAQDCSARAEGSYTGEVSATMERDAGASFVILGHYERRLLFGETPFLIREKVLQAVAAGLQVVLCCGETLEDRRSGQAADIVRWQLRETLSELTLPDLVVAYEPGWAIGTGEAADPESVSRMLRVIQEEMSLLRPQAATPLLYGGSVQSENVAVYAGMRGCSGVLIGTASLDPHHFLRILAQALDLHVHKTLPTHNLVQNPSQGKRLL